MFVRNVNGCDLTPLGGSANSAVMKISAKLSVLKKSFKEVYLVNESPSGLWEKRSGNLLDLL